MSKSACFTGHRALSENAKQLYDRLYAALELLVTEQGITDFYAVRMYFSDREPPQ